MLLLSTEKIVNPIVWFVPLKLSCGDQDGQVEDKVVKEGGKVAKQVAEVEDWVEKQQDLTKKLQFLDTVIQYKSRQEQASL